LALRPISLFHNAPRTSSVISAPNPARRQRSAKSVALLHAASPGGAPNMIDDMSLAYRTWPGPTITAET
jgi:hypothetical protein